MKGNINTRTLIEEINDAAKLLAEIFHQDSSSRKFFALAGANQTVKEAVKDAMPDEFLFGKDCGEKIKAAQMIKKASTQIKEQAPKLPQKINHAPVKKQVNWRGPPQQHQRARGGQRAQHQSRQYSFNQNQTRDQRRQKYRQKVTHFAASFPWLQGCYQRSLHKARDTIISAWCDVKFTRKQYNEAI
ncbi:hypothetical protein MSG28_005416 [Choristoneura fumiferana]|nr:hypothetical protein MSG28_005416 [Choristoneura fumiferana]